MAPVTATLLAGGIALYPAVAHAEAPAGSLHVRLPLPLPHSHSSHISPS